MVMSKKAGMSRIEPTAGMLKAVRLLQEETQEKLGNEATFEERQDFAAQVMTKAVAIALDAMKARAGEANGPGKGRR